MTYHSATEKTWKLDDGRRNVCIWCYRDAALCTIEDPCNGRKRWEANRQEHWETEQKRSNTVNTPNVTTKIEYALQAPNGQVVTHNGTLPRVAAMQWWSEHYQEVNALRQKLTDAVLDMGLPLPNYVIVQRVTTTTVDGPTPVDGPTKKGE